MLYPLSYEGGAGKNRRETTSYDLHRTCASIVGRRVCGPEG